MSGTEHQGRTGTPAAESRMAAQISACLSGFADSPMASASTLRSLIPENAREFCRASVAMLENEGEMRALYEPLWHLLAEDDRVLDELVNPETLPDNDRAVAFVQRLATINERVGQQLVRLLTNAPVYGDVAQVARLLSVLDAVCQSVGVNIPLMPLVPLTKSHDAHIRSKATLLIGRMAQRRDWLERALKDENPRVRANAIEAVWNCVSDSLLPLLRGALSDHHPRVAGNAVLALLHAQDPEAPAFLEGMTRHEDPGFRATAAWVIGASADPRFMPALKALRTDKNSLVFRNALRAGVKLRKAMQAEAEAGVECRKQRPHTAP